MDANRADLADVFQTGELKALPASMDLNTPRPMMTFEQLPRSRCPPRRDWDWTAPRRSIQSIRS